jgi:CRP/FNR family transcriptional regulator
MDDKDVIEKLKSVQLFSSLEDAELSKLSGNLNIRQFRKNEIILYEEDTSAFMYMILDGKAKVVQITEEGEETILAMHRTGDFFGEMSLLYCKTVPATVIATEDTLTAIISRNDFYSLIFKQNEMLLILLQILCSRICRSREMIQLLSLKNASQRIRMLFSLLSEEYGRKNAKGITLEIKLTHRDIASMTGTTRETVTRIMDKWQKDKEVAVLKNRLIRLRPDFLQKNESPNSKSKRPRGEPFRAEWNSPT